MEQQDLELFKQEAKKNIQNMFLSKDEANIELALQLRTSQVATFGGYCVSDLEALILSGCPFKYMAYKAIVYAVGDKNLKSLRCGGYGTGTREMKVEDGENILKYLLLNDCTKFSATFSKRTFVKSLSYNPEEGVEVEFNPINFRVSNEFTSTKWSMVAMEKMMLKLEHIFNNADILDWYDSQTNPNSLPF